MVLSISRRRPSNTARRKGLVQSYTRTIGYLSQHLKFREDTVLKEGCLGLKPADDGRDESYKVETILMGLGFSIDDFSRHPLDLSGGYQVRLHLARLLVSDPDLFDLELGCDLRCTG